MHQPDEDYSREEVRGGAYSKEKGDGVEVEAGWVGGCFKEKCESPGSCLKLKGGAAVAECRWV